MSEADIVKGESARRLLDDPLFREAFDTLETSLVSTLLDLPIEADDQRMRVVAMHKAAQQIRGILGNFVAGSDIARAEILAEQERKTRLQKIMEIVRNG